MAFDGHSAEECREGWLQVQSRLRVHRTLQELLDDAQAGRWDQGRTRKVMRVRRGAGCQGPGEVRSTVLQMAHSFPLQILVDFPSLHEEKHLILNSFL